MRKNRRLRSRGSAGSFAEKLERHFKNHWSTFEFPSPLPDWVETAAEERAFRKAWKKAREEDDERNYRERREMLRARLQTWKPEWWGEIFSSMPSLEGELSAEQRRAWHAAKRKRAKSTAIRRRPQSKNGAEVAQ